MFVQALIEQLAAEKVRADTAETKLSTVVEHNRDIARKWFDEHKDENVRMIGDLNGVLESENVSLRTDLAEANRKREEAEEKFFEFAAHAGAVQKERDEALRAAEQSGLDTESARDDRRRWHAMLDVCLHDLAEAKKNWQWEASARGQCLIERDGFLRDLATLREALETIQRDYDLRWLNQIVGKALASVSSPAPAADPLRVALEKVNAIRNNIIGAQGVNWSRDIYPLVAALEEAGFAGEGYDVARARLLAEHEAALAPDPRDATIAKLREALKRIREWAWNSQEIDFIDQALASVQAPSETKGPEGFTVTTDPVTGEHLYSPAPDWHKLLRDLVDSLPKCDDCAPALRAAMAAIAKHK